MSQIRKFLLCLLVFIGVLCASFLQLGQACTDILLKSKGGPIHARSMEFAIPLFAAPFVVERAQDFQSEDSKGNPGLKWRNKYAYVGIESRVMARGDALDGINEKGLSVAALWLKSTQFPQQASGPQALASTKLISYLLGTAKNVSELKKAVQNISVWGEKLTGLDGVPTVHLACADAEGNYCVVEFISGKTKIYDNSFQALTNDPDFPAMRKIYLAAKPVHGSSRRFCRAADFARKTVYTSRDDARAAAGKYMASIHIPFAFKKSYTQWYIVKDLKERKLYYYENDKLRQIYTVPGTAL